MENKEFRQQKFQFLRSKMVQCQHAIDATVNKEIISSIDSRILEHVSTSKNINTRSKLL